MGELIINNYTLSPLSILNSAYLHSSKINFIYLFLNCEFRETHRTV